MNTPEEVLAAAFQALNFDDWAGFSDLCDPVSLRAFKTETLRSYFDEHEDNKEPYYFDADTILESEPDMPPAVAEYQAAKMNQITGPAHRLKREFLTLESVDQIRQMDPAKLFVLWLQAWSPYRRAELEASTEQPWEIDADWEAPANRKLTRGYRYSVVGSVTEGDIAHVLFRTEHGVDQIFPEEYAELLSGLPVDEQELARQMHHGSTPELATCRKQSDGSWKLVADRDLRFVSYSKSVEAS